MKIDLKDKATVSITIGIVINLLLVLFFLYLYYYSIPKKIDLVQLPEVRVPDIENANLKNEISTLNKIEGVPISVDESELGKQNPYNP